MRAELDLRPVAYSYILVGVLLAILSAVIPHFGAGYRLAFGVLVAGALPYAVYGALTELLRGWRLILPGLLIVPAHAWLTLSERYLSFDAYQSRAIYIVPIVLTVIVLPLGIVAGHLLDKRKASGAPASHPSQAEGPRET